jgi:hypothetical protein
MRIKMMVQRAFVTTLCCGAVTLNLGRALMANDTNPPIWQRWLAAAPAVLGFKPPAMLDAGPRRAGLELAEREG